MTDRLCNVCKKTKPHTPEHFDERKDGRGLRVICRPCAVLFDYDEQRKAELRERKRIYQSRRREVERLLAMERPYRLSWLIQGGLWGDQRHCAGG